MSEINNVAAFGYEEIHKKLIEIQKQHSLIAIIQEKKREGFSIEQICDFLNKNDIHIIEGKKWSLLNG
jgi:IS30 family transposase